MSNKEKNAAYFADLMDNGPFQREVNANGKTQMGYFRRLTAGERLKMNAGIKFKTDGKGKAEAVVDAQEQLRRSHRLVFFSTVTEENVRVFNTEDKVAELDGTIFDALLKCAEEINKEESEPGKSSSKTPS